ncbi:MAG: hypothetical protein AAFY31_03165 [Pseudomonadota bacterium]
MPIDSTMRVVGYLAALGLAAMFYSLLIERPQSFAVSAITEYLRVETVSEGADDWSLVAAHICMPKGASQAENSDTSDSASETVGSLTAASIGVTAECDSRYYQQKTFGLAKSDAGEELTLRWSDDYALDIELFDDNFLYIYITREAPRDGRDPQPVFFERTEIPGDSILFIPFTKQEPLRLVLRGHMTLGERPVRSDALVVREGRYEIREDSRDLEWLNFLSFVGGEDNERLQKHVVANGTLFPGDRITFEREPIPYWARWTGSVEEDSPKKITSRVFVSDLAPSEPGFNVVATTDPQFSSIYLTRVGGQPTRIPVSWAQRLTSDPLTAGLVTLLGLLATVLALRNNFFRR